jgi:hypothetical protein
MLPDLVKPLFKNIFFKLNTFFFTYQKKRICNKENCIQWKLNAERLVCTCKRTSSNIEIFNDM